MVDRSQIQEDTEKTERETAVQDVLNDLHHLVGIQKTLDDLLDVQIRQREIEDVGISITALKDGKSLFSVDFLKDKVLLREHKATYSDTDYMTYGELESVKRKAREILRKALDKPSDLQ